MRKMKDSGVAWIGEIPEEWKIVKIKYYSYLKGRIGWQGLKASEFIDDGPFLVTGTDFENGKINWDTAYHISLKRYQEAPEIQLKAGDLLITKDGTVGKLALIDYLPDKASLNSHLVVIRPLKNIYLNKYLFWTLSSAEFTNYIKLKESGSTMASLSQEKLNDFIFQVPSISEQTAIASFLDKKCALIDSIANDIERQIEILKQYKQSLITETVTKGLDKNVKMKDSEVEWIGEIPEHWKISRVKYNYNMILGKMLQPNRNTTNDRLVDYLCSINVTWNGINLDTVKQMWFSPSEIKTYALHKGDLLVTEGGDVSVASIWNNELPLCCIQNALHLVRNKKLMLNKYLYYWLFFVKHIGYIDLICNKATISHFTKEKFGRILITVPPSSEQHEIVKYLDSRCSKIDAVITDKQIQLDTLKKHKQSLIYEYVTGKKRVSIPNEAET